MTARLYLREAVRENRPGAADVDVLPRGEPARARSTTSGPRCTTPTVSSIQTGNGEWIWRPLVNPRRLLVTSFAVTDPRGFGLVQRDRVFGSYEDLEARYELRPSVWVEPVGSWGTGRVELVQIPTPDETNDNIVAYWVPQQALRPGAAVRISLPPDLAEGHRDGGRPAHGSCRPRRGQGYAALPDDVIKLTVDFDGPALRKLRRGRRGDGGPLGERRATAGTERA